MECECSRKPAMDFDLLEPVLDQYAAVPGSLITILQKAQGLYGYLPTGLLKHIAVRTGIKPAKVLGVATFFTQFRTKPVGKNLILLCQGTACHVNGADAIETAIREELGAAEGEVTSDGLFTYNNVACLGCCSLSPVMMIGEDTYGALTPDKTRAILQNIRKEALSV
jgi:NADH-quinone oxidoreductase subunit E